MYSKRLISNVREILNFSCNNIYYLIRLFFELDFDFDANAFKLTTKNINEVEVYNVSNNYTSNILPKVSQILYKRKS